MTGDPRVGAVLARIDREHLTPTTTARGWQHMGAVIIDAALQAGISYRSVVKPRVEDLVRAWPDADTVTGFRARCEREDLGAVIRWRGPRKLATAARLAQALTALGVDTPADLRAALEDPAVGDATRARLRQVPGVGPKTVDYLGILVGVRDKAAIDVHVTRFVTGAGVAVTGYADAQALVVAAVRARGWDLAALDAAIWVNQAR